MHKQDLLFLGDRYFLAIALLILSFLPLEPACVPGNFFLILSPFIYAAVRFVLTRKLKRKDFIIIGGLFGLIILMTIIAQSFGCQQSYSYGLPMIVQPEWQLISIDSVGPEGLYIKNIKAVHIPTSDMLFFYNNSEISCIWEGGLLALAPNETKYCKLPFTCGDRNRTITVYAPGNNDSVAC
jgi:hypothetical protein